MKQIHLIPFDIGDVFFNPLGNTIDDSFVTEFVSDLKLLCSKFHMIVDDSQKYNSITRCLNASNSVSTHVICVVELKPNLSCYILSNGIGIFLLVDLDNDFVQKFNINPNHSKALLANYQKKISQKVLLNSDMSEWNLNDILVKKLFEDEKKSMLNFREICWNIIHKRHGHKSTCARLFSGSKKYRHTGLSYVVTIYIFNKLDLSKNEMSHLMEATTFNNIYNVDSWENIEKSLKANASEKNEIRQSVFGDVSIYYSWSARAIEYSGSLYQMTLNELLHDSVTSSFLSAEIAVQSNWLLLDCCMENINARRHCGMKEIQLLSNLVEISHAELVNEKDTSMSTVHKTIIKNVYDASDIQRLYSSVILQIQLHQKLFYLDIHFVHYHYYHGHNLLLL